MSTQTLTATTESNAVNWMLARAVTVEDGWQFRALLPGRMASDIVRYAERRGARKPICGDDTLAWREGGFEYWFQRIASSGGKSQLNVYAID